MRFLLSARRQVKVHRFFAKHGSKAVFFARFFAGVRIGVYAYAGQHGMPWLRFVCLDFLGAIISGPTSIWLGKFAAERIADPEGARQFAESLMKRGWHWLYLALVVIVALIILHWLWYRRGDRRSSDGSGPAAVPRPTSLVDSPSPVDERPLSSA